MFWKMLKGALFRRKGKRVMIAFAVGLGVSLATAMLNVMFDVGDKVNQELKTYGANLNVVPRGASLISELYSVEGGEGNEAASESAGEYIAEAELYKIKMIFWAYNIVDFAPYLETRVRIGGLETSLIGTWFDRHLKLPTGDEVDTGMTRLKTWWDIEGQPGSDDDLYGVLVGETLAARLGLGVGDRFEIEAPGAAQSAAVTVRGVFHGGGEEDERIFGAMRLSQDLSNRAGRVQRVEVSALTTPENELARRAAQDPGSLSRMEWDTWYCTAYISSIAYQIEEILPGTRVKPILQVAESEGAILAKTQLLMLLLTVLAMACSALAISNLVTANVMERSAEIGVLKALGATNGAISRLFLSEILIAAFLGGVCGYFAGLLFAQIIGHGVFGSAIAVKGVVAPLVAILVFVVTALGSLPAIR
ncbi:MAG: ABC transporter permease, partial [Candidatus Accumulibacter sp.]|nr:ABC transporter permease [Accumulibacter sp.]